MLAFDENFPTADLTNKKVLLCRAGGIGDTLFIMPLIRALKRIYPGIQIGLGVSKGVCLEVAQHCSGYIDHFEDYNDFINYRTKVKYDVSHDFFGCIEHNPWAAKAHAQDIPAIIARVSLTPDDRVYPYRITIEERKQAEAFLELLKKEKGVAPDVKVVMVQAKSTSNLRSWPQRNVQRFCEGMAERGVLVLFTGGPSDKEEYNYSTGQGWRRDCTPKHHLIADIRGTFALSNTAAIMERCDLLVGPDSGLVHLADAVRTPTIALYGPMPGKTRTRYYPRCLTLEYPIACSPCNSHGEYIYSADRGKLVMMPSDHPLRWKGICPKTRTGESPCLLMIEPHTVEEIAMVYLSNGMDAAKEVAKENNLCSRL